MSPQQIFLVFLALAAAWTVIWGTVMLRSRQSVAYADLAPRVARLRRRLFYALGLGALVVFLVSMRGLPYQAVRGSSLGATDVTVQVSGAQWAWQVSRTDVPAGRVVEFAVTATDVNHGLGIYHPNGRLLTQVQAMPGRTNRLLFRFPEAGRYTLRCLEYCGIQHHVMVSDLTVTGDRGRP